MYLRTIELRFKCKSAYCATAVKWLQGAQRECQSWDENHNIVPVIKQGKQARAHERAEFAPPSYPPPPTGLSNHISVAMCGGRETKISRTSLMHSYCMKYIKKAQTSTRVVGATGRRLSWKKRVYGVFFFPLTTQRERRNKQTLVGGFSLRLLHITGHSLVKVIMYPPVLHPRAITPPSVLQRLFSHWTNTLIYYWINLTRGRSWFKTKAHDTSWPQTISPSTSPGMGPPSIISVQGRWSYQCRKPPPTKPHSWGLSCHPSPALVHLFSTLDKQQTEQVLTQVESLPVQLYHSSEVEGFLLFWTLFSGNALCCDDSHKVKQS